MNLSEPIKLQVEGYQMTIYEVENRLYCVGPSGYEMSMVGYPPLQALVRRIHELERENNQLVDQLMEASL